MLDRERHYTASELDRMNVSYVRLELVPRGVGRIQVRATNFYHELKPGENVQMQLTVYNDGTRRLDNIKVQTDPPVNWVSTVTPDLLESLMPGKEAVVTVSLSPPQEVNVGDYEATIKTESYASNKKVESEDKKIKIHVTAQASFFGTTLLVLLMVGILTGVVVFGIRLNKR